ncbi:MAG: class I SAM-dependent methyltransferase [Bacteroidia bacterium]
MNTYPALAYLRYLKKSVNKHGVHSPFVFELITKVFPEDATNYSSHPAEQYRNQCLRNNNIIQVTDFGTGNSGPRSIAEIASRAAKSPREGQLLNRIARHFKPLKILELGTSLGITSTYLAEGDFIQFITLEGCPETAALARQHFSNYHLNIEQRTGNFSETLHKAAADLGKIDLIYFDGNHRKEPTLQYLKTVLPFIHDHTLLIFDDIHWSAEMDEAWSTIISDRQFHLTIDLFEFGLVMMRPEQVKEHFVLRWK